MDVCTRKRIAVCREVNQVCTWNTQVCRKGAAHPINAAEEVGEFIYPTSHPLTKLEGEDETELVVTHSVMCLGARGHT